MPDNLPPLTTRRFFRACIRDVGMARLQKLYKKSPTEIYRWAADPRTNGEIRRNPLDRIQMLLEDLCELGYDDVARAAVSVMAETIGCELADKNGVTPDGATIELECLQDYPLLVEFHGAIQKGRPIEEVRHCHDEAKREIDETMSMYEQRQKARAMVDG